MLEGPHKSDVLRAVRATVFPPSFHQTMIARAVFLLLMLLGIFAGVDAKKKGRCVLALIINCTTEVLNLAPSLQLPALLARQKSCNGRLIGQVSSNDSR